MWAIIFYEAVCFWLNVLEKMFKLNQGKIICFVPVKKVLVTFSLYSTNAPMHCRRDFTSWQNIGFCLRVQYFTICMNIRLSLAIQLLKLHFTHV